MRTVRVRALSRDRSVTATMTAEAGISVRLEPGSLYRHSKHSLAEAVRATVSGVLVAYRKAEDEIVRRNWGPHVLEDAWSTSAGRRLRPFVEALEHIDISTVGPRGLVTTGMSDGGFRVAFRDAAIRLHESQLESEIDAAISTLHERRFEEATLLYDEMVAREEMAVS